MTNKEGISPEMDEVLNELKEEGVDLDEKETPEGEEPQQDEAGSESEESEAEEAPEESDEDADADATADAQDDEDGEEAEEGDVEPTAGESVPKNKLEYWQEKTRKEREKSRKLAEELSKLKEKSTVQEVDEKLKKIAETQGVSLETLTELTEAISSKVLSPEMKRKIEMASQYQEQIAEQEKQNSSFDSDFEATVRPIILNDNPDITQEEYESIFSQVHQKAFAPTKENTFDPKLGRAPKSLVDIYLESRKSRRVGGERTKIRSMGGQETTFDDVRTADDVENMSDEDFEKSFEAAKRGAPKMIGKKMSRT